MPPELEGLIFPYFFAENRIFGCLGGILEASWAVLAKIFGPSWAPTTPPRCARISLNRHQEPPQRRVPEASGRSRVTKKHPRAAQNPPDLDFVPPDLWRFFFRILARFVVDLIQMFYHFQSFCRLDV